MHPCVSIHGPQGRLRHRRTHYKGDGGSCIHATAFTARSVRFDPVPLITRARSRAAAALLFLFPFHHILTTKSLPACF